MKKTKTQREREDARSFWKGLSNTSRWLIGDQLVLGDFDWRDWLSSKPSRAFLDELDQERMLWESAP